MTSSQTEPIVSAATRRSRLLRRLKGDEKLVMLYMLIEQRLIDRKVGRLCQVEVLETHTDIVVCNLWRIRRFPDGHVEVATYQWPVNDYVTQAPGEPIPRVFIIPFWPIFRSHSLAWWADIITQAVWHTFEQACAALKMPSTTTRKRKSGLAIGFVGHLIIRRQVGKWEFTGYWDNQKPDYKKRRDRISANPRNTSDPQRTGNEIHRAGVYTHESMKAGARALRAAIFEHLLYRPVFSGMMAVDFMNVSLIDYLTIVTQPDIMAGFIRVTVENRNLLPLMPLIPVREWPRADLFGRAHWVKPLDDQHAQATPFELPPNSPDHSRWHHLGNNVNLDWALSCTSRANWRFLNTLPNKLVLQWMRGGCNDTVLRIWREGGLTPKTSPIVANAIQARFNPGNGDEAALDPRIRAVRLLINAAHKVRKREGVAGLDGWLYGRGGYVDTPDEVERPTAQLDHVADYLRVVGYAAGQPDQHQTWETLQVLSNDWHIRQRIERQGLTDKDKASLSKIRWACSVTTHEVDGYAFTAILDGLGLVMEGLEQDHCVDTYVMEGKRGTHRFWKMAHTERAERLTLSIVMVNGHALLDQCYRLRNRLPSKAARHAAIQFVEHYNTTLNTPSGEST